MKSLYLQDSQVISSDIAVYAVQSTFNWERMFNTNVDKLACKAYEIPLKDGSVDLVFSFQSAHHFLKHKSVLKEIYRILINGGICIYLNEPSCNKYMYPLAYKRVNKKRSVPEDVLIYKNILKLATDAGFTTIVNFDTSFINRGPVETIYYYILGKISGLKYILPCGMDYIFTKL